jgi:hypothetical protein
MNSKYTYYPLTVLIIVFLALTAFDSSETGRRPKDNQSIIKFSHSFHADLATCSDCHGAIAQSTTLKGGVMPGHDECGSCHNVEDADACVTCHYDDNFEPLLQKTSELLFNHKFHIEDQKMECQSCHRGLNEVDYSFQAVQPHPAMIDCYSCHNDRQVATNACEACHTQTGHLRPQSHQSANFMKMHKFNSLNLDANCGMCHDSNNNSCIDCHAANNVMTASNRADDFIMPYAPNNFTDGSKQQRVNRVHELNYRFFHGIDAKNKRMDCQSCHETESFCATCHQSEGRDFAMGGIIPATHLKPGFIFSGVGSGGGEHANLARRDIENCSACHDTFGGDPTCINCHLDSDGVKGTNPKTHTRNFMRNVNGDWHTSQGSVCYNCHTSASPASLPNVGFCGYCHGLN